MTYVNQAHNIHSANVTGKNYGFSIVVFQDNTSKNQDFFMTFSAPMSNFRTFQVLKNEKSNFRTFQDQWEPCKTCFNYYTYMLQCFDAVGWVAGRASGL